MADTVLNKFQELRGRWAYDYGVVCKGIEAVFELTNDDKYFNYMKNNMDYFLQNNGTIRYYDQELYNLDYINNGKILLYLYRKTGDEKYADAARLLRKQLNGQPRTSEGGFWHKNMYPDQMWLDGIYMAEPFYAEYIELFEENKSFADVMTQFRLIERHLRDCHTHLLYHGWDESRKNIWADQETGRSAKDRKSVV